MGLTYGNIRGDSVQDTELVSGNATINFKSTVQAIAANATGTQASGTQISGSSTNVAVTSAGAAYSVTLPKAVGGLEIDVLCVTAINTVAVFPAVGDAINALGANAGLTMATSPRVPS